MNCVVPPSADEATRQRRLGSVQQRAAACCSRLLLMGALLMTSSHSKDPHLWRSTSTGHFHALLHNGCDHDCPWVGRHAFSRDGRRWTLSHNIAYTTRIEFADGSVEVHKRRERPHVILSHATGEPVALVTALFEREIPANNATGRHGNDASYTFIQPIKHAEEGPGTRTRTKDEGY